MGFQEAIQAANSTSSKLALGDITNRLPKKVIEMTKCRETGEIWYLCTWHQDLDNPDTHFLPNWVRSHILGNVLKEFGLIAEYFERNLPGAQLRAQLN